MFDKVIESKLIEFKYDFVINFLSVLYPEVIEDTIQSSEKGSFLDISFVSKSPIHCSFDIGFRLNKERKINFFIGEFGGALMQYEDIDDDESEQAVLQTIKAFLNSEINERRVYCGDKLIKVSYLCSEITYPESDKMLIFVPYSKFSLLCLKKRVEEKIFSPRVNL